MQIALDARTIFAPFPRGTGKSLIDLYRTIADMRPGWEFVMLHRGLGQDDPFADLPRFGQEIFDTWGDRWHRWEHKALPRAAARIGADLLHCPANTGPAKCRVPMVLTVHDLIPLEPGLESPNAPAWAKRVDQAARAADLIITPSSYSKQRIVEVFGIPADKITVNHWAADTRYTRVTDPQRLRQIRQKYAGQEDQPYILAFSGRDERKNTRRIIESFLQLPPIIRQDYALVIVGMREPQLSQFRQGPDGRGDPQNVHLHGFAPEKDMSALISAATVLDYPTLAEGFGLPVLDGFRCGTAVLAGNTTSVPEVAGQAALLVDPYQTRSIAEGLERLLTDPALRESLIAKGTDRLQQFTLQATGRRAIEAFEQVVG